MNEIERLERDAEIYVRLGDVAVGILHGQCQYVSRYVGGRHGSPDLGDGLRFKGDPADYHSMRIHADDVAEFVERVLAHERAIGMRR
jgi:hypothetical protein